MLDDEDATEKEYHSATIITKRIGRHLFQLVSPFPSRRFITPLTPPRPATTALCQRRLMELGGIPQKWQRVPPPNALLLGSACGAATPLRIHFSCSQVGPRPNDFNARRSIVCAAWCSQLAPPEEPSIDALRILSTTLKHNAPRSQGGDVQPEEVHAGDGRGWACGVWWFT